MVAGLGLLHTFPDNSKRGRAVIKPELPSNEAERLAVLRQYEVLDSPAESAFDDLAMIASTLCETQMAAVVLVDQYRQWFKSAHNAPRGEAPRDISFCAHAILRPDEVLMVEDTLLDPRFHDNPMVTGSAGVRFYAGAPLVTREGMALGSLCVFDQTPAHLRDEQREALQALSRQASHLLELRLAGKRLRQQLHERDWYEGQMAGYYAAMDAVNADLVEQTRTDPMTGLPTGARLQWHRRQPPNRRGRQISRCRWRCWMSIISRSSTTCMGTTRAIWCCANCRRCCGPSG